jgi:asparagine synthase (glutamine-hydrolysing)
MQSADAIRATGYFDFTKVEDWRRQLNSGRLRRMPRTIAELGLMGVVSTQLWHATYIDPALADLPRVQASRSVVSSLDESYAVS